MASGARTGVIGSAGVALIARSSLLGRTFEYYCSEEAAAAWSSHARARMVTAGGGERCGRCGKVDGQEFKRWRRRLRSPRWQRMASELRTVPSSVAVSTFPCHAERSSRGWFCDASASSARARGEASGDSAVPKDGRPSTTSSTVDGRLACVGCALAARAYTSVETPASTDATKSNLASRLESDPRRLLFGMAAAGFSADTGLLPPPSPGAPSGGVRISACEVAEIRAAVTALAVPCHEQ